MAYDGKCLARAADILRRRAQEHENEQNARAMEISRLSPRIGQINVDMRRTVIGVIHTALSEGGAQNNMDACLRQAREDNLRLRKQRAELLGQLGYPPDYLDREPLCPHCGDSGYTEQGMCSCLHEIYCQELISSIRKSCGVNTSGFNSVDITLYSDEHKPGERTTVQENMLYNVHICRNFVEKPLSRQSLFFCGTPGTGKTCLASATAYELAARGVYVVYVSAGTLFACYEDDRFRRLEEARLEIRRWENCDVLILDDLGTETASAQNAACLYQLLNHRQGAGHATILCANFGLEELSRRYGAPTASRIGGDFIQLLFRGDDLRIRRRGNFS